MYRSSSRASSAQGVSPRILMASKCRRWSRRVCLIFGSSCRRSAFRVLMGCLVVQVLVFPPLYPELSVQARMVPTTGNLRAAVLDRRGKINYQGGCFGLDRTLSVSSGVTGCLLLPDMNVLFGQPGRPVPDGRSFFLGGWLFRRLLPGIDSARHFHTR